MDLVAAVCLSIAILSLGLGLSVTAANPIGTLLSRLRARHVGRLAQARLAGNPNSYLVMMLMAPALLFGIGWLESPVLAVLAGCAGIFVPRLYLAWLVHAQSRRSESEAAHFVQVLLSGLTAGSTYLEALRQARLNVGDPWIREDLDFVIQRFLLDVPLHESLQEVRARIQTPNLALLWETLVVCTVSQLPAPAARTLLFEVSSTIQFNVQLANEVHARSSGQRAQIWLLAVIVPAMYAYLRLMSPGLLNVLDDTMLGRYVLVPLAATLEVLGIVLSFKFSRVTT